MADVVIDADNLSVEMDETEENSGDTEDKELPPITIHWWSEFERRPASMHKLFKMKKIKGKKTYQPVGNKVLDFTKDDDTRVLKVNTLDDLQDITNQLQNKPLFFHVEAKYARTDTNVIGGDVKKKWEDEFAVLINVNHQEIQGRLAPKIAEVKQMLEEGKKFCVAVEFSKSVREWFSNRVDQKQNICTRSESSVSGGATFWLTNHTLPYPFCLEPACWVVCCPFCCLFGGSCYVIHRKLIVKCIDQILEYKDLPVEWVKGC